MIDHIGMRISSTSETSGPLSKTASYALRALLVLARRGVGRPLPASRIAELTGTPSNYLGKTLGVLARAGFVHSLCGPTGGFALAVSPETVSIAQIADVFHEATTIRPCLLRTGPCRPTTPCAAHDRWNALVLAARKPLVETTVADLLSGATTLPTDPEVETSPVLQS